MFDRPFRNNNAPDSLFQSLESTKFLVEKLGQRRLNLEIKLHRALHSDRYHSVLIDSFQRPTSTEVKVPQLSHDLIGHLVVMNRLTHNITIP